MTRSRRSLAVAGVIALLAVPALVGCAPALHLGASGGSTVAPLATPLPDVTPTADSTAPTGSSTSTPAPGQSTAPNPSATTGPPPPPPPPSPVNCSSSSFLTEYIAQDATAGKQHGILTFKNTSGAECETNGYPRVYFVNASNDPDGAEATDDGPDIGTEIQIPKGQTIYSQITFTDGGLVEGCNMVTTHNLSVEDPGGVSFVNVSIPAWTACTNSNISLMTVGIIAPG